MSPLHTEALSQRSPRSRSGSDSLETVDAPRLAELLHGRRSGKGWSACCPAHEDSHASLSIGEGEGGRVLVRCHAGCPQSDLLAALRDRGLRLSNGYNRDPRAPSRPPSRFQARTGRTPAPDPRPDPGTELRPWIGQPKLSPRETLYTYPNAAGQPVLASIRLDPPDGRKTFRPAWHDGRGWRKDWPRMVPLYRLPELLQARQDGSSIVIVEGEKAADAARWIVPAGWTVTTWAGAANALARSDWSPLTSLPRGQRIVIWPDADEPGLRVAQQLAAQLAKTNGNVCVVALPDGLTKGWHLADALAEGWTAERVAQLLDAAPQFRPAPPQPAPAPRPEPRREARPAAQLDEPEPASSRPSSGHSPLFDRLVTYQQLTRRWRAELRGSEFATLAAIHDATCGYGRDCFAFTARQLGEATGLCVRSIGAALRELEQRGLIVRNGRRGHGTRWSLVIEAVFPASQEPQKSAIFAEKPASIDEVKKERRDQKKHEGWDNLAACGELILTASSKPELELPPGAKPLPPRQPALAKLSGKLRPGAGPRLTAEEVRVLLTQYGRGGMVDWNGKAWAMAQQLAIAMANAGLSREKATVLLERTLTCWPAVRAHFATWMTTGEPAPLVPDLGFLRRFIGELVALDSAGILTAIGVDEDGELVPWLAPPPELISWEEDRVSVLPALTSCEDADDFSPQLVASLVSLLPIQWEEDDIPPPVFRPRYAPDDPRLSPTRWRSK